MMGKYKPSPEQIAYEKYRDQRLKLAAIQAPRLVWRGRGMHWDPDQQAIEQERQRWVYEQIESCNELSLTDPDWEYARHRLAYEETGDLAQLRLALEYVRA